MICKLRLLAFLYCRVFKGKKNSSLHLFHRFSRMLNVTLYVLHACCGCLAWGVYRTPNCRNGSISDFLICFFGPFSPTGLPHAVLIWLGLCLVLVHLVTACSVDTTGRPAFFWREMEEQEIWAGGEVGGGLGGVEEKLWLDVVYERKINKKRKRKKTFYNSRFFKLKNVSELYHYLIYFIAQTDTCLI